MSMARPTTKDGEPAHAPRGVGRLWRAWRAAHEPAAGVPRWAHRVACAVPLVVLPSGIWRLGVLFTEDKRGGAIEDWAMNGYIVFLTLFSEVLAFTAVGLVARWGEVVPRWVPWLRGRRIPTAAVVVPATIGATILTLVFTVIAMVTTVTQSKTNGDPLPADFPSKAGGWETVWFYAAYVPLVLWGPMLGILTYAYWRRRGSVTTGPLRTVETLTPNGSPGPVPREGPPSIIGVTGGAGGKWPGVSLLSAAPKGVQGDRPRARRS